MKIWPSTFFGICLLVFPLLLASNGFAQMVDKNSCLNCHGPFDKLVSAKPAFKAESKETWVTMAKTDFALVTNTLASIPVAEKISAVIENDPKLVEEKSKTAAQEVEAKVSKVIGEGFTFKKL